MAVRFFLMGMLRVRPAQGSPLVVKSSRAGTLLAALLLHANDVVAPEYLNEVMWGSYVPSTARASLHTYISRLRQLLCRLGIDATIVETVPGGYRIRVGEDELDTSRFTQLVAAAEQSRDAAEQRGLLDMALGLRDGAELLRNVPSAPLREHARRRLDPDWIRAAERWFDLRLAAGDYGQLRVDLRAAIEAHPDHPRFGEQLVDLLWRTGEQGEALRLFSSVRAYYRDVLFAEPRATFLELGEALRTATPAPQPHAATAAATARVGRSPIAVVDMIGRDVQRDVLLEHLRRQEHSVAVVTGVPGAGKTALALHVAEELEPGFTRSAGFLRLREASGAARCPDAVLAEIADAIERTPPGRSPMLVLDDAASADQVAPLLAATRGRVVITSRRALPELAVAAGVLVCRVGGLTPVEADDLLGEALGEARLEGEADAAAEIARFCGWLPLALRIAAVRLSQRPRLLLRDYLDALRCDPKANLSAGVSRGLSYAEVAEAFLDRIEADLRAAFGTLARTATEQLDEQSCAQTLGLDVVATRQVLDRLIDWNLVEECEPGKYRFEPLLCTFMLHRPTETTLVTVDDPDVVEELI